MQCYEAIVASNESNANNFRVATWRRIGLQRKTFKKKDTESLWKCNQVSFALFMVKDSKCKSFEASIWKTIVCSISIDQLQKE